MNELNEARVAINDIELTPVHVATLGLALNFFLLDCNTPGLVQPGFASKAREMVHLLSKGYLPPYACLMPEGEIRGFIKALLLAEPQLTVKEIGPRVMKAWDGKLNPAVVIRLAREAVEMQKR